MPVITLPDGSKREYPQALTVAEVAASIGAGLAKAALAGRVDGNLVDTSFVIEHDAQLSVVTDRDADGLDMIRHSTAHLLAFAVKELFPDAQVTIGPVIENGFYYDFSYKRPFTPEDLTAIELRMAELSKKDIPVSREVWQRDKAVEFFESIGEHYKAEIIASIPADQDVSLYREGDFVDLCRGPHVPSTGKLKVFKLMKVAGAYWRGDAEERNAAADLRHCLGEEGRAGRLSAHAGGSRKARSPASWVSSSTCSTCRKRRRAWCSGIPRVGLSGSRSSSTCDTFSTRPATAR
jgi:threonyl-tRNA synthetase